MRKLISVIIMGAMFVFSACTKDNNIANNINAVNYKAETVTETDLEDTTLTTNNSMTKTAVRTYNSFYDSIEMQDQHLENINQSGVEEYLQIWTLKDTGLWWAELGARGIYDELADSFAKKDKERIKSFFVKKQFKLTILTKR